METAKVRFSLEDGQAPLSPERLDVAQPWVGKRPPVWTDF
jgi:hypothetical protein